MYERYFDLTRDPFSIAPDPHFLYMSPRHREALAHLLFGINGSGGIVLLTGDIGTGKTTVCRCFLEQVPDTCRVAIIFNPKLTVLELLQTICQEFQVPLPAGAGQSDSIKTYVDALNRFLLHSHAQGQSNVLIIDEAQNLRTEVLEQLRLLTNLETNERKLLQIILIGQPELQPMLARPELEQLAQRVIARFHLGALNLAETQHYIQHRLSIAGLTGPIPFDARALQRIHGLTGGVPRRINLLCGRALLGAWANGLRQVNAAVITQAAHEVFGAPPPRTSWLRGTHLSLWVVATGVILLAVALGMFINRQLLKPPLLSPPTALAPTALPLPPADPQPSASAPALKTAPSAVETANSTVLEVQALAADLARTSNRALAEIAPLWKIPESNASVCQAAVKQQVQCFRSTDANIPLLKRMARPGVLVLQIPGSATVYAALVGLGDTTATLRVDGVLRTVSIASLTAAWQGEFITLWAPPSGYTDVREGGSATWVSALDEQLSRLEGRPIPADATPNPTLNAPLVARVKAFQRSMGLKADGHPGPMTLMQLDRTLGGSAPLLQMGDR